ncbi:hypothetical protein B0T13DRAFT_408969, partial [Neurospora crassa]
LASTAGSELGRNNWMQYGPRTTDATRNVISTPNKPASRFALLVTSKRLGIKT